MNLLNRNPSASVRIEPLTRQIRRRTLSVETLESRALLSVGYAAPSCLVAPAVAASSPAALVAQAVQPQAFDSGAVDLRHAVAE